MSTHQCQVGGAGQQAPHLDRAPHVVLQHRAIGVDDAVQLLQNVEEDLVLQVTHILTGMETLKSTGGKGNSKLGVADARTIAQALGRTTPHQANLPQPYLVGRDTLCSCEGLKE